MKDSQDVQLLRNQILKFDKENKQKDQNLIFTLQNIKIEKLHPSVRDLAEQKLQNLKILIIRKCQLRTFENFPRIPRLINIDVSCNMILDTFQFLCVNKNITYINVGYNFISSYQKFEPLRVFKNISVYARGNPFLMKITNTVKKEIKSKLKKMNIKLLDLPKFQVMDEATRQLRKILQIQRQEERQKRQLSQAQKQEVRSQEYRQEKQRLSQIRVLLLARGLSLARSKQITGREMVDLRLKTSATRQEAERAITLAHNNEWPTLSKKIIARNQKMPSLSLYSDQPKQHSSEQISNQLSFSSSQQREYSGYSPPPPEQAIYIRLATAEIQQNRRQQQNPQPASSSSSQPQQQQ